ncbi:MAG TPA: hypothetical protein VL461_00295 [Dictyobacter sp.]|jgi:hypothetical protein|nr:hypothetical protein [Dictyobacter sp.]
MNQSSNRPRRRKEAYLSVQKQATSGLDEVEKQTQQGSNQQGEAHTTTDPADANTMLYDFGTLLQTIIHGDRSELARVAQELDVTENTVYRWLHGASEPRTVHLRRLPDIFPEHRQQLIEVINTTFNETLGTSPFLIHEIDKNIYRHVLELATLSHDDEARFWQISQAIFDDALQNLDPDHKGLAITYARLMPPRQDGIHSLREVAVRGHSPWSGAIDCNVFLGSTTLAGATAVLQRQQIWNDIDNGRTLFEVDEFERSACTAPIIRGTTLAGVLIVSSTQPTFFKYPQACEAVTDYGLLMANALSDKDYQPLSLLHLRPMPDLNWQRETITQSYINRIIIYARTHNTSRREAELQIQYELEQEFEEEAHNRLTLQS